MSHAGSLEERWSMLVGNEPCRKAGGEVVFVCEQWAMPEA